MYRIHTLYTAQCTQCKVHCDVYCEQCTLYNVQYTLYCIHCTVYTDVQCTVNPILCYRHILHLNMLVTHLTALMYTVHLAEYTYYTLLLCQCMVFIASCTITRFNISMRVYYTSYNLRTLFQFCISILTEISSNHVTLFTRDTIYT